MNPGRKQETPLLPLSEEKEKAPILAIAEE
jgi:hypothetical protein